MTVNDLANKTMIDKSTIAVLANDTKRLGSWLVQGMLLFNHTCLGRIINS